MVFNTRGEREQALAAAGREMLAAFEALLGRLLEAPSDARGAGAAAGCDLDARSAALPGPARGGTLGDEPCEAAAAAPSLADMLQVSEAPVVPL